MIKFFRLKNTLLVVLSKTVLYLKNDVMYGELYSYRTDPQGDL